MREQIKDTSGRTIGFTDDSNEYRQTVTDASGSNRGWFNSTTGKTHDRSGRAVSSSGDIRTSLLSKSDE